jgi:hypothetical protein
MGWTTAGRSIIFPFTAMKNEKEKENRKDFLALGAMIGLDKALRV